MEKAIRLFFGIALCLIISSCSSDDENKAEEKIPQTTFIVNGMEYKTAVEETILKKENECTIVASNSNGEKLKFWLDIENKYPLTAYDIEYAIGQELRLEDENNARRITINFDKDKDKDMPGIFYANENVEWGVTPNVQGLVHRADGKVKICTTDINVWLSK